MMLLLLILDSLGTSELLVILVVALIFFGPRKLPQLSRQIGKSLAEFRKASDDFKRTWEREVALETHSEPEPPTIFPHNESVIETTVERGATIHDGNEAAPSEFTVAPQPEPPASETSSISATNQPTHKQDWL